MTVVSDHYDELFLVLLLATLPVISLWKGKLRINYAAIVRSFMLVRSPITCYVCSESLVYIESLLSDFVVNWCNTPFRFCNMFE